jgi:predicted dehydrogenase
LIEAVAGLELTSIVTRDPERIALAHERHPGAEVLDGAERVWERAGDHDLVVVATPNRAHAPLAGAAIAAGLHVVVDKPLAASSADGRALAAAARSAGVVLAVFHNRRWDGDFLTARRLIEEGALGEVQRFESRFERWRPELDTERWRERPDPAEAGGVLFDLGPHLIDQALVLFGDVRSVYAEVARRRPGAAVDDDAFVAFEHASGVHSHLSMSLATAQPGPRLRVLGDRAGYVKWGLDSQEDLLRAGRPAGEDDWGREPPELWGTVGSGDDLRPVETEPGDYRRFYKGVAEAVRSGGPPPVGADDGVVVLELIEAARASAEARRVVAV